MLEAPDTEGDGQRRALRIAVLGAECTGKTELVLQLREALVAQTGQRVTAVLEYLREWCEREGRTPTRLDQAHIAQEQQRRIDEAAQAHDIVLCDTTPLMTALYSQWYFRDHSLDAAALRAHTQSPITLVTALDLPWQPDGLQRDGEAVRRAIHHRLQAMLGQHELPYRVIEGVGQARLSAALAILEPWLERRSAKG
jgi:nicotinamide riboside kinase